MTRHTLSVVLVGFGIAPVALAAAPGTIRVERHHYSIDAIVYHGRLYRLRCTHAEMVAPLTMGGRAYERVIAADYEIRNVATDEITRFSMTFGTAGAGAGSRHPINRAGGCASNCPLTMRRMGRRSPIRSERFVWRLRACRRPRVCELLGYLASEEL
jgi:hypothetical protein